MICPKCKDFLATPGKKSPWHILKEWTNCNLFSVNDELCKLFRFVETKVKTYFCMNNILKPNFLEVVVIRIITSFIDQHPDSFKDLKFHENESDHRYSIIKSLCRSYVFIRLAKFIQQRNLNMKKRRLRRVLCKMLHFKNQ